jgi:hypothetical protein
LRSSEVKPIGQQVRCYSKEISDDLKYARAGAKHLIVVTNLDQDDASNLYDLLMQSIRSECRSLKVVDNSICDVIRMASEAAEAVMSTTKSSMLRRAHGCVTKKEGGYS